MTIPPTAAIVYARISVFFTPKKAKTMHPVPRAKVSAKPDTIVIKYTYLKVVRRNIIR